MPRLASGVVAGFRIPENLRFHPGHTWALSESPSLVRVGMDDFASKLTGKVDSIALPQRGQWIRQGQKICTLRRDGTSVDMVSFIDQFFDAQRQVWKDSGGSAIHLPEADQAAMLAKISSIADDLSATKPDLNATVKTIFAAAAKNK